MITLLPRRRAAAEAGPDEATSPHPDAAPDLAHDTGQAEAHLASRVSTIALCACLALSPVGAVLGAWAITHHDTPTAVATATAQDTTAAPAQELAQRVVAAWLGRNSAALSALVKDTSDDTLPAKAFVFRDLSTAAVTRSGTTWAVTVAATVTDVQHRTARRYFQVDVAQATSGTLSVLALPAPVSGPTTTPATTMDYPTQLSTSGAVALSVTQFLQAYLSGQGDVGVYVTPGHSLPPLSPAPFHAVRLTALQASSNDDPPTSPPDGAQLQVLATAEGTVTRQQITTVAYALTLTARAGRWEITQIDPAPAQHTTTP